MQESINSLRDALDRRAQDRALVMLAGGTDLYPALGDDHPRLRSVVDISGLAELRGIERHAKGWRIGACTTWTEINQHSFPSGFRTLQLAAREVGGVQIQNTGTIGGNLCNASPAADGVPALLALDASVELSSVRGVRQLSVEEFILGPRQTALAEDELLTAVLVPPIADSAWSRFRKLGARKYLVISIVMVSIVIVPDATGNVADVRVAVGACGPRAVRLRELEASLLDHCRTAAQGSNPLSALPEFPADQITDAHLAPLAPIDDIRGTGEYRRAATRQVIADLLAEAGEADGL